MVSGNLLNRVEIFPSILKSCNLKGFQTVYGQISRITEIWDFRRHDVFLDNFRIALLPPLIARVTLSGSPTAEPNSHPVIFWHYGSRDLITRREVENPQKLTIWGHQICQWGMSTWTDRGPQVSNSELLLSVKVSTLCVVESGRIKPEGFLLIRGIWLKASHVGA
jgi:hypothetical protein